MSDEHLSKTLKEIIHNHPSIPTDELQKRLEEIANIHLDDGNNLRHVGISPCIMISLLRELIAYRDKYGLLETPSADWDFEDDR